MTEVPAIVNNARLDLVAANTLGQALFAPVYASPGDRRTSRSTTRGSPSSTPRARDFWTDWERAADDSVAQLRTEAGRDPYNQALTGLVGELSTRSEPFRTRWAAHNVRLHRTGLKHFHHPVVGDLHLNFEAMELPADPGLSFLAFSAAAAHPTTTPCASSPAGPPPHQPADAPPTPN